MMGKREDRFSQLELWNINIEYLEGIPTWSLRHSTVIQAVVALSVPIAVALITQFLEIMLFVF